MRVYFILGDHRFHYHGQNRVQPFLDVIFQHATCDLFDFLDLAIIYLLNATFVTSLAFQISMLERLERNIGFKPKL